ncbi:DUF885 domain-containing protein [Paraliomyxa miuraensis]|uniref:DUF885 domain-containing protein n=1 Tax=Paraliomyxa miuraensis TaxID=376150 RepID=UPI002254EB47|nr:DUF885 domain-containing protein [Paraliomyxa miuraensis]MCX4242411.1 DUF885 domain-containing protein [Paraliomyxa miuraensis]
MTRSPRLTTGRPLRRIGAALGLGLALLASSACQKDSPPPIPPADEPAPQVPPLEAASAAILDAWFQSHPVTATGLGEHRFDGQWPSLSAASIDADRQRIEDGIGRLSAIDPKSLDATDRVDLDMLRNELELQRFAHEIEQPWLRSPMWYSQLIGSGLDDLVSRDYAPVDDRARAVAARLQGLPTLCEEAIANLQPAQVMGPHTEVARGQLDGVLALIDELPARLDGAAPATLEAVTAASPAAREAVQELREHSEALLPEAAADWRLGKDAFERKLRLTLHTELSADEVRRRAILEHAAVRGRMVQLATELADVLLTPAQRRTIDRSSGDRQAALVSAVLEELAQAHPSPDELRDVIEAKLARLDAFVREAGVVTLDDGEVLQVIWTPPHQRGVAIAGLAAPGPLDAAQPGRSQGLPSYYLVQPIPSEWPQTDKDSYLREYNDFMLEILSIHEAIPGHFVQLYYSKKEPSGSKIRKILANGPFVEGWAVYAEHVMVDAGYDGAAPAGDRPGSVSKRVWKVMTEPRLRAKAIALHGLKFYLRTVTNALLDHSLHAGTMDELEALELMVFRSFQQESEAKAKWVRAQVTSTQLSTYFVGAQDWKRLREQAQARASAAGETFDARAFHDEALSHGAPPIHSLPLLMGWNDAPATPSEPSEPSDEPALEDEAPAPETPTSP